MPGVKVLCRNCQITLNYEAPSVVPFLSHRPSVAYRLTGELSALKETTAQLAKVFGITVGECGLGPLLSLPLR